MDDKSDDDEFQCGKPCPPEQPCNECYGFWKRMMSEGYWDGQNHRWTDKGWMEIVK